MSADPAPAAAGGRAELHTYTTLREANEARQIAWCAGGDPVPDLAFRGVELAGETGEALNVIKKLERERRGWRGSRASIVDLAEELADVVICADLAALSAEIDLDAAVRAKFNATSEKVGLPHRLAAAPAAAQAGPGDALKAITALREARRDFGRTSSEAEDAYRRLLDVEEGLRANASSSPRGADLAGVEALVAAHRAAVERFHGWGIKGTMRADVEARYEADRKAADDAGLALVAALRAPAAPPADLEGLVPSIANQFAGEVYALLGRTYSEAENDDIQGAAEEAAKKLLPGIIAAALRRAGAGAAVPDTDAMRDVLAERRRQVEVEGWTLEHDDEHGESEMALAACCYISPALLYRRDDRANEVRFADPWPWDPMWDRRLYEGNVLFANEDAGPSRQRRMLVKGVALAIAEIERLDRAEVYSRIAAADRGAPPSGGEA